jgi:hypothetical protein
MLATTSWYDCSSRHCSSRHCSSRDDASRHSFSRHTTARDNATGDFFSFYRKHQLKHLFQLQLQYNMIA